MDLSDPLTWPTHKDPFLPKKFLFHIQKTKFSNEKNFLVRLKDQSPDPLTKPTHKIDFHPKDFAYLPATTTKQQQQQQQQKTTS